MKHYIFEDCKNCGGSGKIEISKDEEMTAVAIYKFDSPCPECDGLGYKNTGKFTFGFEIEISEKL